MRMGSMVPKQFLLLRGKPLIWYSLNTFLHSYPDLEIILVLPEEHLETGRIIVQSTSAPDRIWMTPGGQTRFHSVKNGLQRVQDDAIVFVHDGVRCLVTKELIHRCYHVAAEKGNAIPAIAAVDSMRFETGNGNEVIDRHKIKIIQTPQTFRGDILKTAFEQGYGESFTDEASVVEKTGVKINLVEGDSANIKITRPVDLVIAEKILEERDAGSKL